MEYVEINGAWFSTGTFISKKDFFETYKNKVRYPFDCEDTYTKLVKYLPKKGKDKTE